jgi:hypothetical protein
VQTAPQLNFRPWAARLGKSRADRRCGASQVADRHDHGCAAVALAEIELDGIRPTWVPTSSRCQLVGAVAGSLVAGWLVAGRPRRFVHAMIAIRGGPRLQPKSASGHRTNPLRGRGCTRGGALGGCRRDRLNGLG